MGLFRREVPEDPRPTKPINYPDGFAVETESAYYFIKGGKRLAFPSERVFLSWNLAPIRSSEASVGHLPLAKPKMGYRDGSLVVDFKDNQIYLISGGKRRLVTNPSILDDLNLDPIGAIVASHAEVLMHPEGEELA